MEKPIYPSQYMRITQSHTEGTHIDSYAIDEAGSDSGIDYMIAPFTGVIKKIYTMDANEVWLESLEPVLYPDGTIDYLTMMFAHDNNVSNLKVGQIITRGARFYEEGTAGNATGNHVHMECGKGKFTGSGWHQNKAGYWSINNGKLITECLFIDDSIKVLDSHGYIFKKMEEETEIPERDESKEENTDPKEQEDSKNDDQKEDSKDENEEQKEENKMKLIFTCEKTDMYAIHLEKNQKLYLE